MQVARHCSHGRMYIEGTSFTSQSVAMGCFVLHCRGDKAIEPKQDCISLVLGWSTIGCCTFSMLKIVCFTYCVRSCKESFVYLSRLKLWTVTGGGVPTLYEPIGAKFGSHLLVHEHLVQSGTPRHAGGDELSIREPLTRQALQLRLQTLMSNTYTRMNRGRKLLHMYLKHLQMSCTLRHRFHLRLKQGGNHTWLQEML